MITGNWHPETMRAYYAARNAGSGARCTVLVHEAGERADGRVCYVERERGATLAGRPHVERIHVRLASVHNPLHVTCKVLVDGESEPRDVAVERVRVQ